MQGTFSEKLKIDFQLWREKNLNNQRNNIYRLEKELEKCVQEVSIVNSKITNL